MTLAAPLFPAPPLAAQHLDDAGGLLRDLRARLEDLHARSASVAAQSDWRSPSARAFGDRVDAWRGDVADIARSADAVSDALARAGAEVRAGAWSLLG